MTHNQPPFERKTHSNSVSSEFRPARLQRRSYYIALALALLGLGVSLVNIFRAPQKQQKFSLKELNYSQVIYLFDNGAPEIIVSHPFGTDTLYKDSDYILLRDKIENQISNQGATKVSSKEEARLTDIWESNEGESEPQIPTLRLDINGAREAGSLLRFQIEDYDPSVFYYIDFGDGYRRKVNKNSVFTYSRSGVFTLNLYASIAEKGLYKSYAKVINIAESSKTIAYNKPQTNTISDLFPESKNEDLIKKPVIDANPKLGLTDADFEEIEADTSASNIDEVQISDLGILQEEVKSKFLKSENPPKEIPETIIATPEENEDQFNAYYDAEMMPEFPGGTKAMARYLKKNAKYPQQASTAGVEGTVTIRMIVRADGSLSDLKVLKGLGYGCDDEALRLVNKMPKWIPGVQNGVSVPVYKVVSISFKLIE